MQCGTLEVPDSYSHHLNQQVMDEVQQTANELAAMNITNNTTTTTTTTKTTSSSISNNDNNDNISAYDLVEEYDSQLESDCGTDTPPLSQLSSPSPTPLLNQTSSSAPNCSSISRYSSSSSGNSSASSNISNIRSKSSINGSLDSVDSSAQRLAVLSFEQVKKLNDVMNEVVYIHGRGNFPTLEVKLNDLVTLVKKKLEMDIASGGAGMIVKDIRLNGGAASHVLASEPQPYNDLDLIFAVEFSSNRHYDRVKSVVLNSLFDLLPDGVSRRRITTCSLKEAYVGKMVKVNNNNSDGDRWSLISLGNSPGNKNVELKFVDTMGRQFEFSVDSFQIVLDSLLLFYDCAQLPISENFYPTVVGESVYGDFQEALYHLQKKLISTRHPEDIRGGGLLKYCYLRVRNYRPVSMDRIKTLERYMCSRFFIDFPETQTQRSKLEGYLRNHFWGADEEPLQYQYLMHLYEVVETSTVCLMGHERRQTLHLIESLAIQVFCREQQKYQLLQHPQMSQQSLTQHHHLQQQHHQQQQHLQQHHHQTQQQQQITLPPQPGLLYANGVYYAPVISTTYCTCNTTWLTT